MHNLDIYNIISIHTNSDDIKGVNFGTKIDKNKKYWINKIINKKVTTKNNRNKDSNIWILVTIQKEHH